MQLIFGPTFFQENTYFSSLGQGNATSMQIRIFHGWYQSLKSDSLNNWVKISRIDTVKNIISGEFQFDVYGGQNQSNKIVLSEGRFDLPYYPQ